MGCVMEKVPADGSGHQTKKLMAEIEKRKKTAAKNNEKYELARKLVERIKKGVTKEAEVLGWFGLPVWIVEGNKPLQESGAYNGVIFNIKNGKYPAPRPDQKILGYRFDYINLETFDGFRGGHGQELDLLITINTESSIIEDFSSFKHSYRL